MKQENPFPNGVVSSIHGRCMILKGNDIDTDRIIPARFLKCVSFENLGDQVFADDRKEATGSHPFDLKNNQGSKILIVGKNFGCGSSREHAPQALMRWGIRAIVGNSFAEIFDGNCLSLGIPCVSLLDKELQILIDIIEKYPSQDCLISLEEKVIKYNGTSLVCSIDKTAESMLLSGGWDATSILISQENKIKEIQEKLPYIKGFHILNKNA